MFSLPIDWCSLGDSIKMGRVWHGWYNGGRFDRLGSLLLLLRGRVGVVGVRIGLLGLVEVLATIEDVLDLVGEEEGDGAGGDVLGVTHLHQLVTLIRGEVSPGESWILLVQSSSVQTQVVANLESCKV